MQGLCQWWSAIAPAPAADHFTSSSSGVYRASASRDRGDSNQQAMMEPIATSSESQQELEHQRQLMELMQQMQQQMRQMQHQEQQAREAQTQQGAPPSGGNERQSQQLIMKGFDKIEVFPGGEEQWQNWSWKIKTAVSGMNEEFAEMLTTAEAKGIESIEEVLREAKFVDANRERCVKASKELYGVLARYTNSEEMDGVRAWARLHANYSRRTLGRSFRVQRECMYPKPAKDVGQVRLAIMAMGGEVEGDDV